jgi:hypothetical protein
MQHDRLAASMAQAAVFVPACVPDFQLGGLGAIIQSCDKTLSLKTLATASRIAPLSIRSKFVLFRDHRPVLALSSDEPGYKPRNRPAVLR